MFIPHYGWIRSKSWRSKWIVSDRQQDPPHLVLCSSSSKGKDKGGPDFTWYDTCIQIILGLTFAYEFWCVYHELFGKLKSGMVLTSGSSTFLLYDWFWKLFLQGPTIALFLQRISHVAQCIDILTKALPLFILLLKMAYVELKVGKRKHALVSHILQNQTTDPWR